ncbi:MAG: phosphate ABC transporter ATP-binding protein [Sakamotonia sp.]|jgi:phosphate transport system ATP-binding protein
MEEILTLKDVSAFYGEHPVLKEVTMGVRPGRILAVMGPSGSGKTTFLRALNGLLWEESEAEVRGEICLLGRDIRTMDREELRRKVGLVFQTPQPFPFSIYKNMTYAPRYYGIRNKERLEEIVREKLMLAGLYEEVKDVLSKSALKLSGGQKQRLCIARALTAEPEVLLLDEPCSALDVKASAVVEETLLGLKERYTIVIVTHNIAQARRIADDAAFFFEGRLVEYGEAGKLFTCPEKEETRSFLAGVCG